MVSRSHPRRASATVLKPQFPAVLSRISAQSAQRSERRRSCVAMIPMPAPRHQTASYWSNRFSEGIRQFNADARKLGGACAQSEVAKGS